MHVSYCNVKTVFILHASKDSLAGSFISFITLGGCNLSQTTKEDECVSSLQSAKLHGTVFRI